MYRACKPSRQGLRFLPSRHVCVAIGSEDLSISRSSKGSRPSCTYTVYYSRHLVERGTSRYFEVLGELVAIRYLA